MELGWSDELPFKEEKEWRRFIDSLKAVNNISIDRCIVIHRAESIELHAFSDASEKAYGSSIYLKSISALGEVKVCLVTSKSRVSPLKQISIPRLELCGAVLAAKLMKKVKEALNLQITAVHFWSDSTIVISWIHRESRELKTFVANRVSKIHQLSSRDQWHHIASEQNPADVLSKGLLPEELRDDFLWWHGPELLQSTYSTTVIAEPTQRDDFDCELRVFIENCRSKVKKRGPLTTSEDDKGILRVGGRLEKASIPYSQKHPAKLAKNSKLSKIYFITLHKKLFHVGPQGLLNAVRLRFWALGGRNLARKTVHTCVVCFKCKPIPSSQIMGNLPYERVNMAPPFSITGLDLGGPYFVTYKHQRKGVLNKNYVCVCICFVTRAIHLEMLSDLTSDAIIATLKRFMSRRGKCSKIFTDNATNFVGANSQLKVFYKTLNFPDQNLAAYFTEEGIEWNFIPPRAPHMGGLWEAGIKSVKYHLKRALGRSRLAYEEFETVIIQVEGILNSRPLTPISNDFDNFETLHYHTILNKLRNVVIKKQHGMLSKSVCLFADPALSNSHMQFMNQRYGCEISLDMLVQFHAEIVEVEIDGVAINRPFGEFCRAKSDALDSTAVAPIEKAEVIADSLQTLFEPNTDVVNPIFSAHTQRKVQRFLDSPTCMDLEKTSPSEIQGFIKNLKPNKYPGIDLITNRILKNLPTKFIIFIALLFNMLLENCYLPKSWRKAVVIPILKPNSDDSNPQNYRPISLLSSLSKAYEFVILNCLN
ncbi:RNA-directed DNA polymerase from mobile element jockey [Trichonephila clavipes]|nr:RNA-directed DNA polymerase from mobile element jockey [Trichonephila clavipes]